MGAAIFRPAAEAFDCTVCRRAADSKQERYLQAFCYASSPSGILVFQAFMKKTRATPKQELDLGERQLKELLHEAV